MTYQKQKKRTVSIVIPNWNGVHLLRKNLPTVIAACGQSEILVTDDASIDGSVSYLHQTYPDVRVIEHDCQQGFAGNVNSGVAKSRGDIVVLLNTDVRPEINFLEPLLVHFDDPTTFAVGCLEKSYEPGGIVLRGRGIARWERGFYVHSRGEINQSDTAWVSGGSGAFRKSLWITLGGMDELYNPFYWEDIDISYQAKKSGYRTFFEKKSIVGHYHEEGKIKTVFTSGDVKRIAYRNQFIFLWKNISNLQLLLTHLCWTPIRLIQAILTGDTSMISGYAAAVLQLPLIYKSRVAASQYWHVNDLEIFPSYTNV